jgi:hypothetical protein
MGAVGLMILNFGTYLAFRRPRLHTAAHPTGNQDHKSWTFPLVRGTNLRLQSVGRLGLEPRTGGL